MSDSTINLQYTTLKYPLPEFIHTGIKYYTSDSNAYHSQPPELISKLAKIHNIPEKYIYVTAGNDEAIKMLIFAYGQKAYTFTPTYIGYNDVNKVGGKLTTINALHDDKFEISTERLPDATIIFVANPNNPFGLTPKEKIIELIKNNPDAKVVIDEAYGEYSDQSVLDQVVNFENLIVLRSFSKAYGMAGIRIGFMAASPTISNEVMNKLDTEWANTSYLSVGAAMSVLDNEVFFAKIRDEVIQVRNDFHSWLIENGFTAIRTNINAVLLKFSTENEAHRFVTYLKNRKIIVSLGNGNSNIGLDNIYVRISIGTKDQMNKVKEVIGEYK
jgi:histidinol-phosphate aminotransferase